tara:strand:+ start:384 stop:704 length:321 start_codon:yes stop_codon:yes gene_type:complete
MKKILWWLVFILGIAVAVMVYIIKKRSKSTTVDELEAERARDELEFRDEISALTIFRREEREELKRKHAIREAEISEMIAAAKIDESASPADISSAWADHIMKRDA